MALTKVRNIMIEGAPVNVKDFGAVGDGVTDDTAAINAAILSASTSKFGLIFEAGKDYLVSSTLSFSNSASTIPRWVDFKGCSITAHATSFTGSSLVYVENPHGKVETFLMSNVYIDCSANSGINYGFYMKGGQDGRYTSIQVVRAASNGFLIQAEANFGIYYNVFDTCKAGGPNGLGNGAAGFRITGGDARRANANTFLNCAPQYNATAGFSLGKSSGNVFIGCAPEENIADAGWVFGDGVTSVSILGGFSENNTYSGVDVAFRIKDAATVDNIRISGGRHNGTTHGDFTKDGIQYDTTSVGDVSVWNTDLSVRNLTSSGVISIPNQPAFNLEGNTESTLVLNAWTKIDFTTENFDQGTNVASSIFTAPVDGKYQFNFRVRLNNVDTAASYYAFDIRTSSGGHRSYFEPDFAGDLQYLTVSEGTLLELDSGDTCELHYYQSGGAAQSSVDSNSWFSGFLVA